MKEKKKQKNNISLVGNAIRFCRENLYVSIGIFSSFIIIFLIIFYSVYGGVFFSRLLLAGFKEGNKAERDLVSDRNFIFVDNNATRELEKKTISSVLKVFKFDKDKIFEVNGKFENFSNEYTRAAESDKKDSFNFKYMNKTMNSIEIDFLLTKVDPYIIIPASSDILQKIMLKGIIKIPPQIKLSASDLIQVWKWNNGRKVYHKMKVSDIPTLKEVDKLIENSLMFKNFPEKEKYAIHLVVRDFIKEDIFYDSIQTDLSVQKAESSITPVTRQIKKGQRIITKGLLVTGEQLQIAAALYGKKDKTVFGKAMGSFLYLVLIYFLSFLMFKTQFSEERRKIQFTLTLLIFAVAYVLYTAFAVHFSNNFLSVEFALILPVALFPMIFSIISSVRTGGLVALFFSLFLFVFPSTTIYDFLFALISAFSGAYFVRKSETRIDLLKAGVYLSAINVFIVFLIFLLIGNDYKWLLKASGISIVNAFLCSIVNLSFLPVIEHILNLPTAFRLVELSDMSNPVFKRMIVLAPGTYGHSMIVANLAESAARDIGANPLLARVGAYYHDIGKIDQSEYFIENQKGDNKHDDIKPSLSAAVIKSHVKIGIERGKELGLPPEVIDIIAQHHGTGVINYFYIEAIKKGLGSNPIAKEDFSYKGVSPQSKEAGILMLADSVEAASRILKKPTVAKLEKFIWGIILDKVETNQLENCPLTFKDLVRIKKSFIQILAGQFHSRIEYPKIEDSKQA